LFQEELLGLVARRPMGLLKASFLTRHFVTRLGSLSSRAVKMTLSLSHCQSLLAKQ